MTDQKVRIGELLVEAGVLTEKRLDEALDLQRDSGLRLGSVLIQRSFVTEPQLIQALSKQLSIPWVSLWHLDISEQLLDMIPEEIVVEHGVLPIYIRSLRDGRKALYVAMDNPADEELLETIEQSCGLPVKPMIAGPSEIGKAIHSYYGRRWRGAPLPTDRRLSSVPPPPPDRPETEQRAAPDEDEEEPEEEILLEEEVEQEGAAEPEPPPVEEEPAAQRQEGTAGQEPPADEEPAASPAPVKDLFARDEEERPRRTGRKFQRWRPSKVNLTFLDGTSVSLGGGEEASRERSTEDVLDEIGSLALEGEQGRRLALAVKGILKTLLRRGLLTDAELEDLLEGR
jgi:type IV pilus assembly protein PilB